MLEQLYNLARGILVPEINADLYIFGSYLYSTDPQDIDLLLIIGESTIPAKEAYSFFQPFVVALEKSTSLPVDITILTHKEHSRYELIKLVNAVKLRNIGKGRR